MASADRLTRNPLHNQQQPGHGSTSLSITQSNSVLTVSLLSSPPHKHTSLGPCAKYFFPCVTYRHIKVLSSRSGEEDRMLTKNTYSVPSYLPPYLPSVGTYVSAWIQSSKVRKCVVQTDDGCVLMLWLQATRHSGERDRIYPTLPRVNGFAGLK